MEKAYQASQHETAIYDRWMKSGAFSPRGEGKPFSIMMPPPNVTGVLHVGHALFLTLQDILTRYHRMKGEKTLWLPGTDHAAIATQAKVEELLYRKEGKTRHDLGREEFLKMVQAFAQTSKDTILEQIKRMGASCDWDRLAYTLDEQRNYAVRLAFTRMYEDGLIYRGNRIVNWDPKLQTTVSDDEIVWQEEKAPFYYLKYGPFVIATARPETKFGDKYVVMHPDDERYKQYTHGQQIEVEWINGKITATIIKDEAVDMAFGTGVMTITPWHDATDFDIAGRHNLDTEQIIDFKGKLLPIAGEFAGIHIKKARPLIVEKLSNKGLVEKVDEHYLHRITTNSRGGGIIEPQIKEQWFIAVDKEFTMKESHIEGIASGQRVTLKQVMRHVVSSGLITIIPDHFEKIYYHWIDNLRDWCISRQIWYGHRIPAWYQTKASQPGTAQEPYVGVQPPEGEDWEQDPDTLDTWFSSGLWTFSTLGWPEKTDDLQTFHPTDVLETGYDILFFWVARMILMTTYHLGDIPFKTVYLHGLVRDEHRQKMSKSKGNTLDPVTLIDKYGADALRMALVVGNTPGTDLALSEDKIRGYQHFANKVWNATRFVTQYEKSSEKPALSGADKQILDQLEAITQEITSHLDAFQFYLAAEKLYHYFWHTFADTIIEQAKPRLAGEDKNDAAAATYILYAILERCLILLHPFMPFATETIWQEAGFGSTKGLLITTPWK